MMQHSPIALEESYHLTVLVPDSIHDGRPIVPVAHSP